MYRFPFLTKSKPYFTKSIIKTLTIIILKPILPIIYLIIYIKDEPSYT